MAPVLRVRTPAATMSMNATVKKVGKSTAKSIRKPRATVKEAQPFYGIGIQKKCRLTIFKEFAPYEVL